MFNIDQVILLLVPIISITWIIFGMIQHKTKQISKIQLTQFLVFMSVIHVIKLGLVEENVRGIIL